jgi:hypothetical protein
MTGLAALLPARLFPGTASSTDNSASLTGVVKFEGTAPKPSHIDMSADANCAKAHPTPVTTEDIIVGANSGLADGIIYVSDGLGGRTFQPPQQPAVFEQKAVSTSRMCWPCKPTISSMWSTATRPPTTSILSKQQSGVEHDSAIGSTARTNIHTRGNCNSGEVQYTSWIRGYIAVFEHPYFVVTDTSGSFDLSPGSYTITAWQEKLGTLSQMITVGAGETKTLDFSFKQ